MITKVNWWKRMEARRTADGRLPETAFDFIGVHCLEIIGLDGKRLPNPWSLSAPLCLVRQGATAPHAHRPRWENIHYRTKGRCVRAAKKLARIFRLRVVDCSASTWLK